jgi:hypothetical protein
MNGDRKLMTDKKNPDFNENESPILRLFLRKDAQGKSYLSETQFRAAELLRRDFEASRMAPRMVASYREGVAQSTKHWQLSDNHIENLSNKALDARERLHKAFDNVGPELSGILYHVCCLAAGIEHAERVLALPVRSGKAVLKLSLTALARHYGMIDGTRSKRAQSCALPDYKPVFSPPQTAQHPI